jgi:hypothetical protein
LHEEISHDTDKRKDRELLQAVRQQRHLRLDSLFVQPKLQRQYPRDTSRMAWGKGKKNNVCCGHILSCHMVGQEHKRKAHNTHAVQLRGAARHAHLERRDACARPKGRHEQLRNQPQHDLRACALQPCPEMMDCLTTVTLAPSH